MRATLDGLAIGLATVVTTWIFIVLIPATWARSRWCWLFIITCYVFGSTLYTVRKSFADKGFWDRFLLAAAAHLAAGTTLVLVLPSTRYTGPWSVVVSVMLELALLRRLLTGPNANASTD